MITIRKSSGLWWCKCGCLAVVIFCLAYSGIGCGGSPSKGGGGYDCGKELNRIQTEEYCDLVLVERLETQIVEFRKKCSMLAEQSQKMFADKLQTNNACANKKYALELHHKRCTEKMEAAGMGMDCVGKECKEYRKYVEEILRDCSDPELEGVYEAKAEVLYGRIKERKKDAKRLSALRTLSKSCVSTVEKVNEKNAKRLLETTTKIIKKKGRPKAVPEEGSEFELDRGQTFLACEQALQSTLEIVMKKYSDRLGSNRLKIDPKKWKKVYKELKMIRARLNRINAAIHFTLPLELVENTIAEFDPDNTPTE